MEVLLVTFLLLLAVPFLKYGTHMYFRYGLYLCILLFIMFSLQKSFSLIH